MKRVVALVVMLATTGSAAEAVLGLVRDGVMHHESSVAAIQNLAGAAGDHGRVDGMAPSRTDQHGRHQHHGTPADHCTHQHGPAVIVTAVFGPISAQVINRSQAEHLLLVTAPAFERFNPPRA